MIVVVIVVFHVVIVDIADLKTGIGGRGSGGTPTHSTRGWPTVLETKYFAEHWETMDDLNDFDTTMNFFLFLIFEKSYFPTTGKNKLAKLFVLALILTEFDNAEQNNSMRKWAQTNFAY